MSAKHIWESEAVAEREKTDDALAARPSHAGRRVLVTGGGAGIGRAIALGFAARGATVGIADVSEEAIQATASDIGEPALPLHLDISNYGAVKDTLDSAAQIMGGPFDTVVNNAGISPKHDGKAHKVWEMDPDEWQRVVAVNLTGTFNTIRVLAPSMREAGRGWIVNMSSVAGKTYSPIVACHYAATKSAMLGFTKHLAAELGPFGIRVNAMAPGRIATPMVRGVSDEVNAEQVAMTPMARLGEPEEVADVALWLTSSEASFVTGQTIDVAGGLYMT